MKRAFFAVLAAALVGGLAFAQTETDFSVTLTKDGQGVVITKYLGSAAQVVIPASIQGMPVREIGERAFDSGSVYTQAKNRPENISIVIPSGVTAIRKAAFMGQRTVRSITIPSTVTTIEQGAFASCGITSIVLPSALKSLDIEAFQDCRDLETVKIPADIQITVIPRDCFVICRKLASVTIPEGITEIGTRAFSQCEALPSISLPSTIKRIGGNAFYACSSLADVTIPESVVTIEFPEGSGWAFRECSKMKLVTQAALKRVGYTGSF